MPLATLLARDRQRLSPIASITPSGVATSTVATPRIRLFFRARVRLGSSKTEPSVQQYHCVEKPCQVLRDRPSLNENCTAISTGSSDQRTYSQVTVARTYGLRQGLRQGGTHFFAGRAGVVSGSRVAVAVIGGPSTRAG